MNTEEGSLTNGLQRGVTDTDVLIIGGGPAGLSAAYGCQTLGIRHLLLEGSHELGGQLSWTQSRIHGLLPLDSQSPADIRRRLVDAVVKTGCNMETCAKVEQVVIEDDNQITVVISGERGVRRMTCQKLVVATGAKPRRLGIPGEDLPHVYGASFSLTRHAGMFQSKVVAVVGGGDRALEGALYAASAGAKVILIHRGSEFRARHEFRDAVLQQSGVKLMLNTNVIRISPSAQGIQNDGNMQEEEVRLCLVNHKENRLCEESVDAVVIRIGMTMDTHLLRGAVKLDADDTVVTDRWLKTMHPDIYAIGDIATPPFAASLATAISHGALAARHIALTLGN